jgi:hypothetical protein
MGLHDPFGYLKRKLWPKEGPGVKLPIWLPTTKSQEFPWFPYVHVACHIPLESFWKGYNFAFDLISIRGLHTTLWVSKVAKVLILGISRLPLGSLETKWHLGTGLMAMHIVYYKGEGDGFPQVRAVVNLVNLCLPVVHPCTKNITTLALGLRPRQKGLARLQAKKKSKSHTTCSQECRKVWGNEPSHSQGNSHFRRWSPGGLLNL